MKMSLENKVKKDFYFDVSAKITEFFSDVESAAKKDLPSKGAKVEITNIKFNKASIKLNKEADNVRSKEDQKPRGEAE